MATLCFGGGIFAEHRLVGGQGCYFGLPSTATSESPVTSTASSSWSPQLGDSFTETVVRATKNSIPAITSSIQSNNASLRISSQVPGDSASAAPRPFFSSVSAVCASTSESVSSVASGTFTLPAFVAKSTPVLAITVLSYTRHVAPTPSNFISPALLAVFQALSIRLHHLSWRRLLLLVQGMPLFLQNWCLKL